MHFTFGMRRLRSLIWNREMFDINEEMLIKFSTSWTKKKWQPSDENSVTSGTLYPPAIVLARHISRDSLPVPRGVALIKW